MAYKKLTVIAFFLTSFGLVGVFSAYQYFELKSIRIELSSATRLLKVQRKQAAKLILQASESKIQAENVANTSEVLRSQLLELSGKLTDSELGRSVAKSNLAMQKAQLLDALSNVAKLQRKILDLNSAQNMLRGKLLNREGRIALVEKRIESKKTVIADVSSQLDAARKERKELKSRLFSAEKDLSANLTKLNAAETKILVFKKLLAKYQSETQWTQSALAREIDRTKDVKKRFEYALADLSRSRPGNAKVRPSPAIAANDYSNIVQDVRNACQNTVFDDLETMRAQIPASTPDKDRELAERFILDLERNITMSVPGTQKDLAKADACIFQLGNMFPAYERLAHERDLLATKMAAMRKEIRDLQASLDGFKGLDRKNRMQAESLGVIKNNHRKKENIGPAEQTQATHLPGEQEKSQSSLTQMERESLVRSIQACWNVGALSPSAMIRITIALKLDRKGKLVVGSIRLVQAQWLSSGNAVKSKFVREAFNSARRAVIRCGAHGFNLPLDKYDSWKEVEMTFDPTNFQVSVQNTTKSQSKVTLGNRASQ